MKNEKTTNKGLRTKVSNLKKEVKNLKLTIDAKVKETVDNKDSFENELQSYND